MKDIYLIRHTTPAIAKGVCYGQTDLDVTESFAAEAAIIRTHLPQNLIVHSSPLKRCARLAALLFPGQPVTLHDAMMEIHCGEWEMQRWDDLPKELIEPWMKDFVHISFPGGESYLDMHSRVTQCFRSIAMDQRSPHPAAIVAHGGVIRSILSYITGTPLIDSFKVFALYYGCVVRITGPIDAMQYEILSNIQPPEHEQHKPKSYYQKG